MGFFEKLAAARARASSLLCVGLDPDVARIPVEEVSAFSRAVIEATQDLVCAYKPNLAFYEQYGAAGVEALAATLEAIPKEVPVIGDGKRGDIGATASAYARALFDVWGFDAVTVNPYLGADSVGPFVERADRGVFILCRTSNPGARDLQDLEVTVDEVSRPLYQVVAERARAWNRHGNVGLVVGATYPQEAARLRQLCPEMTFLVPGLGAQGAELAPAVHACLDPLGQGAIFSVSRAILYASEGADFAEAARARTLELRDAINRARDEAALRRRGRAVVDFRLGDVLRLRKPHACGGALWEVVRLGADIGLRCQQCHHRVLLARPTLEKRVKSFVARGPGPGPG